MNEITIVGYTPDGWPVLKFSPEYQEELDRMAARPPRYAPGGMTSEELDERCTAVHIANSEVG